MKDNTGKEICRSANGGQIRHNEGLVRDTLTVDNPKLWSLDNPNM
ncbi:MAG: hypothetical protein LBJ72_00005 [Dysgonamonadaceae bacterium]|nr:hypothetical protein [Dysgonamonadaceae bacterium]